MWRFILGTIVMYGLFLAKSKTKGDRKKKLDKALMIYMLVGFGMLLGKWLM